MIKLLAIGHLGKDCITNMVNGKNVMNFTVAHTEKFRDAQGNQKEKTTWVDCAYWSDRTAIAPYLKKGTQVYVEGIPDMRTYPKNDGSTGASLTLRVMNIQLLGSGNKGGEEGSESSQQVGYASQPKSAPESAPATSEISEQMDDLPF